MALCEFHFFSEVLRKQVVANVLLPDAGSPPFPVLYLLHGLSDDYSMWLRRSRIEWYARNLPLIVVMPDGFRGFYTDHHAGPAYGRYIAEELPAVVERNFCARSDRDARCIGGLSMGGYGALRTGLAYPDRYVSANSHSGALLYGQIPPEQYQGALSSHEYANIFGPNPAGTAHDLTALARSARQSPQFPSLLIDCGQDDFLLPHSRAFHAQLQDLQFDHEYYEFPGSHDWDYWDRHVQDALTFHARHLKL